MSQANRSAAEARKQAQQRLARQVYYELGINNRSIANLRAALKSRAAAGLETATRHNQTLTDWRRDMAWDDYCARKQELEIEADMARTSKARDRTLDQLTLLIDDTVAQLGLIITSPIVQTPHKLKAIEMVYKALRIGDVAPTASDEDGFLALPPPPAADATDEEKQAWLAQASRPVR